LTETALPGVLRIKSDRDLEQFGILPLTGEACMLGARVLCDLTEEGRQHICEWLGLPPDTRFKEPWNSQGVASIMLPYGYVGALAPFILISKGYECVLRLRSGVCIGWKPSDIGLEYGADMHQFVEKCHEIYGNASVDRTFRMLSGHPHQGLSAVHAMTGRTA
jgi:hypothetical protein